MRETCKFDPVIMPCKNSFTVPNYDQKSIKVHEQQVHINRHHDRVYTMLLGRNCSFKSARPSQTYQDPQISGQTLVITPRCSRNFRLVFDHVNLFEKLLGRQWEGFGEVWGQGFRTLVGTCLEEFRDCVAICLDRRHVLEERMNQQLIEIP